MFHERWRHRLRRPFSVHVSAGGSAEEMTPPPGHGIHRSSLSHALTRTAGSPAVWVLRSGWGFPREDKEARNTARRDLSTASSLNISSQKQEALNHPRTQPLARKAGAGRENLKSRARPPPSRGLHSLSAGRVSERPVTSAP